MTLFAKENKGTAKLMRESRALLDKHIKKANELAKRYEWKAEDMQAVTEGAELLKTASAVLAEGDLIQKIKDKKVADAVRLPSIQKEIDGLQKWKLSSDDILKGVVSKALEVLAT